MKRAGKQMSFMEDLDRYEIEREKREVEQTLRRLDQEYRKLSWRDFTPEGVPAGTVVIIGQNLYRNGRYTKHFYRAVTGYHHTFSGYTEPHLVEKQTEEWPDVPPWAGTVGHEGEPRDIHAGPEFMYWTKGETEEPIVRWIDRLTDKVLGITRDSDAGAGEPEEGRDGSGNGDTCEPDGPDGEPDGREEIRSGAGEPEEPDGPDGDKTGEG